MKKQPLSAQDIIDGSTSKDIKDGSSPEDIKEKTLWMFMM